MYLYSLCEDCENRFSEEDLQRICHLVDGHESVMGHEVDSMATHLDRCKFEAIKLDFGVIFDHFRWVMADQRGLRTKVI
jgi:hypothetical protein